MNIYVTAGKNEQYPGKTFVGFGSINEYEGEKPNARDVLYKINQIDTFLKAVQADKIPLSITGKDADGKEVYMKADAYYQTGISKEGTTYGFNKIAIEVKPEQRNDKGELVEPGEKLYATKGKDGYAFDKNSDPELIAKFNKLVEQGVEFSLSANKDETLAKYPELTKAISHIQKSANFEIDFEKGHGAYIKSVQSPVEKRADGSIDQSSSGLKKIVDLASNNEKSIEKER
ncbi:hypothetical protein CFV97608_a0016 (plasmid) [Campylobacter fetus subsp. venerealis 97/608]|uniref:hypothetical protein n=1 Tax=Campylobacter fetus TaxID=196 RepID=UPI0005091C16|nr:hypothetical protein [Campylobacter fetus]AIR81565.1 hypothetical protein CFV97608_a0016 [Campylobacter fetus subsp. venerealis 97/608]